MNTAKLFLPFIERVTAQHVAWQLLTECGFIDKVRYTQHTQTKNVCEQLTPRQVWGIYDRHKSGNCLHFYGLFKAYLDPDCFKHLPFPLGLHGTGLKGDLPLPPIWFRRADRKLPNFPVWNSLFGGIHPDFSKQTHFLYAIYSKSTQWMALCKDFLGRLWGEGSWFDLRWKARFKKTLNHWTYQTCILCIETCIWSLS